MTDEDREALAEALASALGEHYDGSSRDWLADALMPVVEAIARRRAAEELRAAATALKWAVITGELGTPMDTVRDLRARAEALDRHEEAL